MNPDSKNVFVRAFDVLRDEGLVSLWFRILGRTVYRRAIFIELPLSEQVPTATTSLAVTVGMLTELEVNEYINLLPDADPAKIRARLAAGQRCFVIRLEGKIVHVGWATTGRVRIEYFAREITLAPDEVFVFGSYTAHEYRGKNLAGVRIAAMASFFREAGYKRMIGIVVPENKIGLSSPQKMGYRPVGLMSQLRLGPWRYNFGFERWDDEGRAHHLTN